MTVLRPSIIRALGLLALLLASPAAGQQLPEHFTLTVSQQGVILIEQGLMELPYKNAAPVLVEITKQVQEQAKAAAPSTIPPAPAPAPPAEPAK